MENKIRFSSHSFGKIMTNDRTGKKIGKTAISYIRKMAREIKYSRKQTIASKYLEKGNKQEEKAITVLSIYLGKFLVKNKERLYNNLITGEPDTYIGDSLVGCKEGFDTKCSWDIFTFPFKEDELDSDYFYQDHCYMWLTGSEKWTTAYVLVNALASQIDQAKKSMYYNMGCPSEDNADYIEKQIEIEKNMIFNISEFIEENPYYDMACKDWTYDIPIEERVLLFEVKRDEKVLQEMENRAIEAMEILCKLL